MSNRFDPYRYGPYLGAYLIVLGITVMTGWWFPGMTLATGLPIVLWCLHARRYSGAMWAAAVFIVSPLLVFAGIKGVFDWRYYGPMLFIAIGVLLLAGPVIQNRVARRG